MLTLTNALTISGCTVYQDDTNQLATFEQAIADRPTWKINDDGTVSAVAGHGITDTETTPRPKYYLLPETPEISKGPDGTPLFSLIVYRRDEARINDPTAPTQDPTKDVGGGILTFTTELVSDKFTAVKAALNTQAGGSSGDDEVEVDYVQFISGDVSIAVAGETGTEDGGGDFVKSIIGAGKLGGVGANRRAVMVKLTQDGASLLSQLDKIKTLPINVQYNLVFEHRLLGVKMIAYCDVESSYTLVQTLREQDSSYSDGWLNLSTEHQDDRIVSQVTEALVSSKTMYVTVIPESSSVSDDTISALEKEGTDILNKEVAGVLEAGPPPDSLDRNQLEKFVQTYNSSLNYTIDRRMVLQQTFTPSANLQNLLAGGKLEDLVAYVDLRTKMFTLLQVPIRVNADFEKLGIDSVTVTVTYNRQALDGSGSQQVRDSFDFADGSTIFKFEAYANSLDEVSYDWSAEVHYANAHDSFTLSKQGVKDNFLVVDVGQLGLIQVDFTLGLVDQSRYPAAKVSARYQSKALGTEVSTELRLDKNAATGSWTAAVFEEPVKGYEYKVDWMHTTSDDDTTPPEIISGNWTPSTASTISIDAPLGQRMTIGVACSGNFTSGDPKLTQVAVALHYEDPANHHVVDENLTFTADNQTQAFDVDLIDPTKRDYTYWYTNIYSGGVVERFPATDGDSLPGTPGFITVGEKFTAVVSFLPLLLRFDAGLTGVEVDVDYEDAGISLNETFIFSSTQNTAQNWYIKGKQDGTKQYGYVVKYYWGDGRQTQTDRLVSVNDKLLVPAPVVPPAPAPPPASAPAPIPAPVPTPPVAPGP
jgi:hypothetical protein